MKNNNDKKEIPQLSEEIKKLNGKSSKNLQKKIGEMVDVCKSISKKENKKE